MAIAPFITPLELGMRPAGYSYTKGGLTIDVEAFAIFYDEKGVYNEYNIESNAILSWAISPNEFFYTDDLKKVFLNEIFVYDVNGDPIDFGAAYPASRVSRITIKIFENKGINARRYTLNNSLMDLTVSYLPKYLKGDSEIDNQATKKLFCTAPIKPFSNEYLILKDKQQLIYNVIIPETSNYALSGTIQTEESIKSFNGAYIPNTFYLQFSTPGKKDIDITLDFPQEFLVKNLTLKHNEMLEVRNVYEDYTSTERLRFVTDFVKLPEVPPYIAPNEFVVEDNINAVFYAMHDELQEFLLERKIVNPMLTKRLGWYDTLQRNWCYYINNVDASYEFFEPKPKQTPINDVFITDTEIFYIKDNAINEITKQYDGASTFKIEGFNDSAPFLNIKNILLDSNKKLFVFDAGASRVGIFKRNFTRTTSLWVSQLYFGGIGGQTAKNKFLLPNSIFLDNEENLHVVDTGNSVIKKYSNDGVWLTTIKSALFDNTIIHGATDSDSHYHILKPKTIAKLTKTGESVTEYKLFNPDTIPIKIITDPVKDFLFVIYKTKIQKYYKDGRYVATIYGTENVGIENSDYFLPCQDLYNFYWSWDALSCAQNLDLNPVSVFWSDTALGAKYSKTWGNQTTRLGSGVGNSGDLDYNIYSAQIDQTRNLYVAVGSYLQKMLSNTNFLYLGDDLNTEYYWDIKDVLIQKEEVVQDWVYNRSFQRMWDNIELVRKAVIKKMNVNSGSYQTKYFSEKDFQSFKLYDKDSIIFGQNEIVTTDVVNRNIEKLWNNIRVVKDMLNYRDLLTEVTNLTAKSQLSLLSSTTVTQTTGTLTTPTTDESVAYFALGFTDGGSYPEFVIQLNDEEKIRQARRMVVGQEEAYSITGNIVPQAAPYNPNYIYHIDPASINFAVESKGLCDVDPMYINRNLAVWMETVKTWCPNSSFIKIEKTP